MGLHKSPRSNGTAVHQMACPERARLLRDYAGASGELADIVAEVVRCAQSGNRAFEFAWDTCEIARSRCHEIQKRIYEHVRVHGCALRIANLPVSRP